MHWPCYRFFLSHITYKGPFFFHHNVTISYYLYELCIQDNSIFTLNSGWRRTPKKHVYLYTSVSLWSSICSSLSLESLFYPKADVIQFTSNKTSKDGKGMLHCSSSPSVIDDDTQHCEKTIGTHNGTFHCDEALAVFLLRQTNTFRDAGRAILYSQYL